MKYDVKALLEEADVRDVAEAIGMETRQKGSSLFTECVNEDHIEGSEFQHAVLYEKRFHCFSCGADYDVFEMVRHYYAKQGTPISFPESCKIVANIYGGGFEENGINSGNKFPLTRSELKTIGLAPDLLWIPAYPGEEKPEMNLRVLFREDPEAFNFLVKEKACEFEERYEQIAETADKQPGEFAPYLKLGAQKNASVCLGIEKRFGVRKKRKVQKLYV